MLSEHKFVISFVYLFMALILFLFPGKDMAFLAIVFISGALAIYGILNLMANPHLIKLSNLLAISLLLGYSVGTVFMVLGGIIYNINITYTDNPMDIVYSMDDLSMALLIVILACLLLYEISRFEVRFIDKLVLSSDECDVGMGKYIFIAIVIVLYAFISKEIGYMGIIGGERGEVGVFGALAWQLVPPLLPIVACEVLKRRSFLYKLFLFAFFLILLLLCIVFGRRVLLYSLVLLVMGLSLCGYRPSVIIKNKLFPLFICVAFISLVLWFGFSLFYAMRLTNNSFGNDAALIDLVIKSTELMFFDPRALHSELSINIVERPFILSYLAGLVSAQGNHSLLMGKEMEYAIQTAIPSLFFPEKLSLLPKMAEEFIHPAFGLPVFDGNNTIITAGMNDFGVVGALLYPVLMIAIYSLFLFVMLLWLPVALYRIVFYISIYQMMYTEASLSGLLFVGIRDTLLIVVVFIAASKVIDIMCGLVKNSRFINV